MAQKHKIESIGANGEYTVQVSPGRRLNMGFDNADGHTYNVIGYFYTAQEDASRIKHIIESGLATPYHEASIIGYVEVGVEVTATAGVTSRLEVLECKL